MENELEIDMSDFDWTASIGTWDDSWLDLDFSEFEKEEEKKDPADPADPEDPAKPDDKDDNPDSTLEEIEELLAWLDEDSEKAEENLKKADEVVNKLGDDWDAWEASAVIEQLKLDWSQQKTAIDQLQKLVSKLNKEKWDMMMKNTELELYGNIEDPNIVYLSWNLEKAKWGDETSKKRIVSILDNLRAELTWSTKEDEELDEKTDMISKVSSFNNASNPNTKAKGWLDEFQIDL